jgi:hypothetical protein
MMDAEDIDASPVLAVGEVMNAAPEPKSEKSNDLPQTQTSPDQTMPMKKTKKPQPKTILNTDPNQYQEIASSLGCNGWSPLGSTTPMHRRFVALRQKRMDGGPFQTLLILRIS